MLAAGAGEGCLAFFFLSPNISFFPLSLGDSTIESRLTQKQEATKNKYMYQQTGLIPCACRRI